MYNKKYNYNIFLISLELVTFPKKCLKNHKYKFNVQIQFSTRAYKLH